MHCKWCIWNVSVYFILAKVDGGMLSWASEHDQCAVFHKLFLWVDFFWEATTIMGNKKSWEAIGMNVCSLILQLSVIVDVSVGTVEFINYATDVYILNSFPNFVLELGVCSASEHTCVSTCVCMCVYVCVYVYMYVWVGVRVCVSLNCMWCTACTCSVFWVWFPSFQSYKLLVHDEGNEALYTPQMHWHAFSMCKLQHQIPTLM